DGKTQLVDDAGIITREARQRDLAPIVGLGPQDAGSLTAALASAARTEEQTIKLTIDPNMQDLVFTELKADRHVGQCPGPIAHWRDKSFARTQQPDIEQQIESCSRRGNRAAIVLLDAEKDPGAILAMASWPPVSRVLNVWDLLAFAQGYESHSPLAGAAWRA